MSQQLINNLDSCPGVKAQDIHEMQNNERYVYLKKGYRYDSKKHSVASNRKTKKT